MKTALSHYTPFLFLLLTTFSFSQTLSGQLTQDVTLDAASSPWEITGNVIVPNGITLTVEPGCTLYFHNNVGITVRAGGTLSAVGGEHNRIVMTRRPGTSDKWKGIVFDQSQQPNMIGYVDMLYGDAGRQIIHVNYSKLVLLETTWNSDDRTIVEVNHPSLIIQNCLFPSVGKVEVVHGLYLTGDEYLILIGNTFGPPHGYNDVLDFTDCKRPGPILEVYNNIFLGGGDDGLDLDGTDSYIEGNIFMNFHKGHDGSSTSNAIATGRRNGKTSDIVVVRNIFYNNDHAVLLKEECHLVSENNIFVKSDSAVVNFGEWPYRNVTPGKGADFNGDIFWNNRAIFENQFSHSSQFPDPEITVNYSLIDSAFHNLGVHNLYEDPLFVNPDNDFHLLPGSPAIGAGPNGLDMGAYVPSGASISGEPPDSTTQTWAVLHIGGPGITDYRYVVNDPNGEWSEERSLEDNPTIELQDLTPGQSYRVYVQGKTFAGHWQQAPEYSVSKMWTVVAATGVYANSKSTPGEFQLYDNYPNPFNSSTLIRFDLPQRRRVLLKIYDVLGREMATLTDDDFPAGTHQVKLNAQGWSSGVYYYHLTAGEFQKTKRFILLR